MCSLPGSLAFWEGPASLLLAYGVWPVALDVVSHRVSLSVRLPAAPLPACLPYRLLLLGAFP